HLNVFVWLQAGDDVAWCNRWGGHGWSRLAECPGVPHARASGRLRRSGPRSGVAVADDKLPVKHDGVKPPCPKFSSPGSAPMTPLARTARYVREQRQMTQRATAEALGVSFVHVSNVERGRAVPSSALVERYREVFGVDLHVLAWC